MRRQTINPWTWQDAFGFSQAVLVEAPQQTLYVAGQGPISPDGALVHEGDLAGQAVATMDNLETVLAEGGMTLADVVSYAVHTTSLEDYFSQGAEQVVKRFAQAGNVPSGAIACQVVALAVPGMAVEISAIACR
jgi:enamine deaminase RidA (YjgF/YER057c/UK114 family)